MDSCSGWRGTSRAISTRITTAALIAALSLTASFNANAVSLTSVEKRLEHQFPGPVGKALKPVLKKYNRARTHRAIAVSLKGDVIVIGKAVDASSELRAATYATRDCDRQRNSMEGHPPCEILLLNNTIVPLSQDLKHHLTPDQPAPVYRISHPGQSAVVHLIGTVHALKPSFHPLAPAFMDAFRQSEQIAVELDPTLSSEPERVATLTGLIQANPAIVEYSMSKSLRKELGSYARSQSVPVDMLFAMTPAVLQVDISTLKLNAMGYDPRYGVDMFFINEARTTGKPIIELETLEEQYRPLINLPLDVQNRLLAETLDELDSASDTMEELLEYWLAADADALYRNMMSEFKNREDLVSLKTALFDERNVRMADAIKGFSSGNSSTLVLVGAGHLGGEGGIIQLLERDGFDVTQLSRGHTTSDAVNGTPGL